MWGGTRLAEIAGDCSRHRSAAETVEYLVCQHDGVTGGMIFLNWIISQSNVRPDIWEMHNLLNSAAVSQPAVTASQSIGFWNIELRMRLMTDRILEQSKTRTLFIIDIFIYHSSVSSVVAKRFSHVISIFLLPHFPLLDTRIPRQLWPVALLFSKPWLPSSLSWLNISSCQLCQAWHIKNGLTWDLKVHKISEH